LLAVAILISVLTVFRCHRTSRKLPIVSPVAGFGKCFNHEGH